MKNFFSIAIISLIVLVNLTNAATFNYVSPKHSSEYNSLTTNIIFRSGDLIDHNSLNQKLLTVKGSKSGLHNGQMILSDDGKTIVFNPYTPFEPSEKVSINLKAGILTKSGDVLKESSFDFSTTPLSKPLEIQNLDELSSENNPNKVILDDTLPSDIPTLTVTGINNPAKGYYFLTLAPYLLMLNDTGGVYKYKKLTPAGSDFEVQKNGQLTYIAGGKAFIVDTSFKVLDSVTIQSGYTLDGHEFICLPNGHYVVMSYDPQYVDMSKIIQDGFPNVRVTGCVIQELDRNKNVVFQWRTWDHLEITESYQAAAKVTTMDAMHMNSIFYDIDGNIVLSFRHLSAIIKINRQTGDVMWRLGGKKNDFTFVGENEANAPNYFSYQHNMRRNSNGNFTLYDNGNQHKPPYSRAVEYKLDEEKKIATLVWEFRHTPDVYGSATGNVNRLENGNTVICWGMASRTAGQPQMTEVHMDKTIALELSVPITSSTYRVFKSRIPACPSVANVSISDIVSGDVDNFVNKTDTTGIEIKFIEFNGSFYPYFGVQRFDCPPITPLFDTVPKIVFSYRLELMTNADNYSGEYHADLAKFPAINDPGNTFAYITDNSGVFHRIATTYESGKNRLVFNYATNGKLVFGIPPTYNNLPKTSLVQPVDQSQPNISLKTNFKWTSSGEYSESEVIIASDDQFNNVVLDTTIKSSDNFNLNSGLLSASKYYWHVRSKNVLGNGSWSLPWSFTMKSPYLTIDSPNGGEFFIKDTNYHFILWKHNLSDTFKIELYQNGILSITIKDSLVSPLGGFAWKIPSSVTPDSNYKIKIFSKRDNSLSSMSSANFTIKANPNGVSENSASQQFEISPNPVLDIIDLTNSGIDARNYIYIFSIDGVLVSQSQFQEKLNVSRLKSGAYFLTSGNRTFKFIKVN